MGKKNRKKKRKTASGKKQSLVRAEAKFDKLMKRYLKNQARIRF